MATQEKPRLDPATARQVIDPSSYAEWDGLLDTFDRLRAETPVAWVEPEDGGVHPPFWLVTRYDDVMRMSKDNATFLNNPHSVAFSLTEGIEFAKALTGGSEHMVASLVTFDAPVHMKYRKLTQEWFMPKNLRGVEDEIRGIAHAAVDRLLETGAAYRDFDGDAARWRRAPEGEVRARVERGDAHAVRFRVPRPDHPVPHVVEDAVRDLRWADVRRTLRDDFVLVRRDGAPLYALCAVCDLCGIQCATARNITTRRPPTTRATASRTSSARPSTRRTRCPRRCCSTRSARRGRATRTARSSSTRVRPAASSRCFFVRHRCDTRVGRDAARRRAEALEAVRVGGDRRRVTKRRLHAARRLRLPRGARRPGAAINRVARRPRAEFRARGPVGGAVDLRPQAARRARRGRRLHFQARRGPVSCSCPRATFGKRVARGVG